MKKIAFTLLVIAAWQSQGALAAEKPNLTFETFSGYFVSNKFEPKAAESFAVLVDQGQFDKVFGVAAVMNDKSHRLPKDAFNSQMVLAVVKRGNAVWDYQIQDVTEKNGIVEVRYTATSKKSDTATFASPLIVSIPKGPHKVIHFVENGKMVKKMEVPRAGRYPRRRPANAGVPY